MPYGFLSFVVLLLCQFFNIHSSSSELCALCSCLVTVGVLYTTKCIRLIRNRHRLATNDVSSASLPNTSEKEQQDYTNAYNENGDKTEE